MKINVGYLSLKQKSHQNIRVQLFFSIFFLLENVKSAFWVWFYKNLWCHTLILKIFFCQNVSCWANTFSPEVKPVACLASLSESDPQTPLGTSGECIYPYVHSWTLYYVACGTWTCKKSCDTTWHNLTCVFLLMSVRIKKLLRHGESKSTWLIYDDTWWEGGWWWWWFDLTGFISQY